MWSNLLTRLSRKEFETGFCNVKSEHGKFGFLSVHAENPRYRISIFDSEETLTFNGIEEIIGAGWVID